MAERDSSGSMTAKQTTPEQTTPAQVVGSAIPKPWAPSTPLGTATPKPIGKQPTPLDSPTSTDYIEELIKAVRKYMPRIGGETNETVGPGTNAMFLAFYHAMTAVEAVAAQPDLEAQEINYAKITAELATLINAMLHDDRGCVYLNNVCAFAFNMFVRSVYCKIGPQPMFKIIARPENVERPHREEREEKQYECIRTVFTYIAPHILKDMKSVSQ
jgi:hypothetical protein